MRELLTVIMAIGLAVLVIGGIVYYVGKSAQVMTGTPPDLQRVERHDGDGTTVEWRGTYDLNKYGVTPSGQVYDRKLEVERANPPPE